MLLNKSDLVSSEELNYWKKYFIDNDFADEVVSISAEKGTNLKLLYQKIDELSKDKIEKMKAYYIEDKIDIRGMKYKIFDNHCELYASKEELEKFRDKYNIDEDIIYSETKKIWHLAFTGYWFYLIKYGKVVS